MLALSLCVALSCTQPQSQSTHLTKEHAQLIEEILQEDVRIITKAFSYDLHEIIETFFVLGNILLLAYLFRGEKKKEKTTKR